MRRSSLTPAMAAIAIAGALALPSAAQAAGTATGGATIDCGTDACGGQAATPSSPGQTPDPTPGGTAPATPDPCQYSALTTAEAQKLDHGLIASDQATYDQWAATDPAKRGTLMWKLCPDSQGEGSLVIGGPAAPPTVGEVARQARFMLPFPQPHVYINPFPRALVNLPAWLAVDGGTWKSVSASLTLQGTFASVTATPYKAVWSMGQPGQPDEECDGPGTQWSAGMSEGATTCSFTYTRSSSDQPADASGHPAYAASVTVSFRITYTGRQPGGPTETGTLLPDGAKTTDFTVPVEERQTVVTGAR